MKSLLTINVKESHLESDTKKMIASIIALDQLTLKSCTPIQANMNCSRVVTIMMLPMVLMATNTHCTTCYTEKNCLGLKSYETTSVLILTRDFNSILPLNAFSKEDVSNNKLGSYKIITHFRTKQKHIMNRQHV